MLKKHIFACMMASALVAAPALAQTTTAPGAAPADAAPMTGTAGAAPATGAAGTTGTAPMTGTAGTAGTADTAPMTGTAGTAPMTGTAAPATGTAGGTVVTPVAPATGTAGTVGTTTTTTTAAPAAPAGMAAPGAALTEYITAQQPGQVMADALIGTRVVSPTDENIGDITDLVLDAEGRVVAATIGVGGFLGIGQKDVGVPFEALQIMVDADTTAATTGVVGTAPAGAPGTVGTAPAGAPGTVGTTATGTTGTGGGFFGGGDRISRIILNATRDQLRDAPEFQRLADMNRTGAAGTAPATAPVGGVPPAGTAPAAPGAAPRVQ